MNRKLSFTIVDEPNPLHTRTIMDLCDFLTDRMLVPRFHESGAKWEHAFMDFFTFDNSCDPLQPVGTVLFAIPPLLAGCTASLEETIVAELARLKIKTGPITIERHARHPGVSMMRIPVIDNPTVLLQPPEVNMSKTRGFVVLRDLLGYQPVDGGYSFDAEDLLRRVEAISEERIAACTASPVRDAGAPAVLQVAASPVSVRAVHRCLEEIREFAAWAVKHHYRKLAAA